MPLRLTILIGLIAASAQAQATHRTAQGAQIALPDIMALDCPQMAAKMAEIDASGYRSGGPQSAAPGDKPLLAYENRLSARYFRECVSAGEDDGAAGALNFTDG